MSLIGFSLFSLLVSDFWSAMTITSRPSNLFCVKLNFIFVFGRPDCLTEDFLPGSFFYWVQVRTIFLRCSVQSISNFPFFLSVFLSCGVS